MEKEIKGIIDFSGVRYWVDKVEGKGLQFIEFDECVIVRNNNGSFNVQNVFYKTNFDLYPSGINAVIYK